MIVVTGGTGFVGSAVVEELLRRGQQVAVLGRDAAKIQKQFGGKVEARTGDVSRPETLATAFAGADAVIDTVQFPTSPIEVPRRGWTFEKIDYQGSVNQVDAAKAAGTRRYVYVSGVGAAKDAAKHWFRFKWLAEEHVRASGLEWAVVRPTWVYGPGDKSLNRLIGFSKVLPFVPMFGDGKQAMQPVFIDDVARVVADAALAPAAPNAVFELGGPETMSMNEVLQAGLKVLGRKRPILHQPMFVGKALGTIASLLPITPPLSADAVDFIASSAVADNTAVEAAFHPKLTPLREGLAMYLGKR
ncbi:MAG TPA: NAD(P)H-binding protein [Dehalococcoidia bacterium]|nr:NAD(P)H-binding protein [Dehalococcoidia bacterium]